MLLVAWPLKNTAKSLLVLFYIKNTLKKFTLDHMPEA